MMRVLPGSEFFFMARSAGICSNKPRVALGADILQNEEGQTEARRNFYRSIRHD